MDLSTIPDDELDEHRRDVLAEQERRRKIAQLPDDLAAMACDAVKAGCDPTDLLDRLTDVLTAAD